MASSWVPVAPEIAKTHPLYGVGGWLIIVAIGSAVSPLRNALELYPIYSQVDFASLAPEFRTFLYVEIALNILFMLWSLGNIALMLLRHPAFPASLIGLVAGSLVLMIGDAVGVKMLTDHLGQPMSWGEIFDPDTLKEIARTVVAAAIWIPYALISKRVNVTYRHRVRADDPILTPKEPAAAS